jgi:hypothetical protein
MKPLARSSMSGFAIVGLLVACGGGVTSSGDEGGVDAPHMATDGGPTADAGVSRDAHHGEDTGHADSKSTHDVMAPEDSPAPPIDVTPAPDVAVDAPGTPCGTHTCPPGDTCCYASCGICGHSAHCGPPPAGC